MTLFIMPIALVGLQVMPEGSNPDLYVLTLPLSEQRHELALLAFLGGFSSATSMVIVAAIAVSTMVSNHIVMPVALRLLPVARTVGGDVRGLLLTSRRISITVILGLGFLYFYVRGGDDALAAIGLIAFVGVAQFMPSLVGGLFWRGATRDGAIVGLVIGFLMWAYTLFLPSLGGEFILSTEVLQSGPWNIAALRPQSLLGLAGMDPLVHAVVWSVGLNALTFVAVSTLTHSDSLERLQAALFVDVYRSTGSGDSLGLAIGGADSEALFLLAQHILGAEPTRRLFDEMARSQGRSTGLPHATDIVVSRVERELAGSIGAASAHAMVTRIAGNQTVGMPELIDIADETQQLIETSRQLSQKSEELERAAQLLRVANERLRALDAQKDEFLSQISHELRTPMTSIRSFSEILLDGSLVSENERQLFVSIIYDECLRLTRLLNEILDIGRLEAGTADLQLEAINAHEAIAAAHDAVSGMTHSKGVTVEIEPGPDGLRVFANADRLHQVLINILSNAVKYNPSPEPHIRVRMMRVDSDVRIDVIDNGGGVTRQDAATVFEKFARGSRADTDQGAGAGLGLPISRAIMHAMGGGLTVEFEPDGTSFFQLTLPTHDAAVAARREAASTD